MMFHDNKPSIEEALEHYGVKGMKWGVRKDRSASREKKGQKFDRKAEIFNTKIKDLDPGSKSYVRDKDKLSKKQQRAEDDAQRKREGKLSTNQKRVLAGAAVAATAALWYAGNAGDVNRLVAKGKMALDGTDKPPWKQKRYLTGEMDVEAIQKLVVGPINPNYGLPGTKTNCRRATYAYELRRRGYDVAASHTITGRGQGVTGAFNPVTPGDYVNPSAPSIAYRVAKEMVIGPLRGSDAPKSFAEDARMSSIRTTIAEAGEGGQRAVSNKIFQTLATQPNGARGELDVTWKAGGAHSIAWEVVKGKPVLFDAQSGNAYLSGDDLWSSGMAAFSRVRSTRLDNIELNEDFLLRWVRDAKSII